MEEFFKNIEFLENGCWEWKGEFWSNGRYGVVKFKKKESYSAHRMSFLMFNDIPKTNYVICHKCDNTRCVNPEHLFQGTRSDNMKDASIKNRLDIQKNPKLGENNNNAKYTREYIEHIRKYYCENNVSFLELAKHFGLKSKGHAHAIINKKIWA